MQTPSTSQSQTQTVEIINNSIVAPAYASINSSLKHGDSSRVTEKPHQTAKQAGGPKQLIVKHVGGKNVVYVRVTWKILLLLGVKSIKKYFTLLCFTAKSGCPTIAAGSNSTKRLLA